MAFFLFLESWHGQADVQKAFSKVNPDRVDHTVLETVYDILSDRSIVGASEVGYGLGNLASRILNLAAGQTESEKTVCDPFIKMFESGSSMNYLIARKSLLSIGKSAVPSLIDALTHRRPNVRQWAAQVLGDIKDVRAVDPLGSVLKDNDADVRKEAATAIGKMRDHRGTEPLVHALEDSNWEVCANAAAALGKIKAKTAIEPLIVLLGKRPFLSELLGRNWRARMNAAWALSEIAEDRCKPILTDGISTADTAVTAGAHRLAIRIGKAGWETDVIAAWDKSIERQCFNRIMGANLLNSENGHLRKAIEIWAKQGGYQIVSIPGAWAGDKWGAGSDYKTTPETLNKAADWIPSLTSTKTFFENNNSSPSVPSTEDSASVISPAESKHTNDQKSVCPKCGYHLKEPDWRCPECYYEFPP